MPKNDSINKEEDQEHQTSLVRPKDGDGASDDDSSSDDDDDDDLILEGVLVRNPDASSSSSSSDDGDDDDDDDDDEDIAEDDDQDDTKLTGKRSSDDSETKKKKADSDNTKKTQSDGKGKRNDQPKTKKRKKEPQPKVINVDFTFCDMDEKYFHGLKTLLSSSSPVYAGQTSSELADLMIENVAVGTVVSTEADRDGGTVYGFASVLNFTTYKDKECIKKLKELCLSKCPPGHQKELEIVLSGSTKRPAGLCIHSRMVNLPMEIVQILHDQLVKDMEWAVENAEGGEEERKSLNFGAFVRIAPTYRSSGVTYFKYFDDEVLAQRAEFKFDVELPKGYGSEETPYCTVIVLTKTGHRAAMADLDQMVNGGR